MKICQVPGAHQNLGGQRDTGSTWPEFSRMLASGCWCFLRKWHQLTRCQLGGSGNCLRLFIPNWCLVSSSNLQRGSASLVAAVVGSRASSSGLSAVAAGWPPSVRDHFLIFFLSRASPIVATELLQKGIVLALMGWISADFWLFVLRINAMVTTHFVLCRTVAEQVNPGSWTFDWAIDWLFPFSTTPEMYGYAGYAACSMCFLWSQHCLHAVLPAGMLQVARRRN